MPSPPEHIEWWTKQAAHDLEMAKPNRQNGFHDGCALMCQQSGEKYLKALYIKRYEETPPKTHQCDRLATLLGAPPPVVIASRLLEADYTESRYPDAANGVPFERFSDQTSQTRVTACEEVQQWVLQQLNSIPPSSAGSATPSSGNS
jgi:HEPN domain-containing protein